MAHKTSRKRSHPSDSPWFEGQRFLSIPESSVFPLVKAESFQPKRYCRIEVETLTRSQLPSPEPEQEKYGEDYFDSGFEKLLDQFFGGPVPQWTQKGGDSMTIDSRLPTPPASDPALEDVEAHSKERSTSKANYTTALVLSTASAAAKLSPVSDAAREVTGNVSHDQTSLKGPASVSLPTPNATRIDDNTAEESQLDHTSDDDDGTTKNDSVVIALPEPTQIPTTTTDDEPPNSPPLLSITPQTPTTTTTANDPSLLAEDSEEEDVDPDVSIKRHRETGVLVCCEGHAPMAILHHRINYHICTFHPRATCSDERRKKIRNILRTCHLTEAPTVIRTKIPAIPIEEKKYCYTCHTVTLSPQCSDHPKTTVMCQMFPSKDAAIIGRVPELPSKIQRHTSLIKKSVPSQKPAQTGKPAPTEKQAQTPQTKKPKRTKKPVQSELPVKSELPVQIDRLTTIEKPV